MNKIDFILWFSPRCSSNQLYLKKLITTLTTPQLWHLWHLKLENHDRFVAAIIQR